MTAAQISIAICTAIVIISPILGWCYDRWHWGHLDEE
jgi:hypothetical protein